MVRFTKVRLLRKNKNTKKRKNGSILPGIYAEMCLSLNGKDTNYEFKVTWSRVCV